MQLGLISQIRDEIDIIEPWLNHVDALFDQVFLIDHQSLDGTGDILKQAVAQRPKWSCYSLKPKTKLQRETSNLMMHEAMKKNIDFLFFLDADEFLQTKSRHELEANLSTLKQKTVGQLYWRNCILPNFSGRQFTYTTPFWIGPKESSGNKVVIPRELYIEMKHELLINEGNHNVMTLTGDYLSGEKIGNLLHVPIRSREQLIKKVILNIIAVRGYKQRHPRANYHIREMLGKIAEGKLADDDLRGFALKYDSPKNNSSISNEELTRLGYSLSSFEDFNIARTASLHFRFSKYDLEFERQVANALNDLELGIPTDIRLIVSDGVIQIDEKALKKEKSIIKNLQARLNIRQRIRKIINKLHVGKLNI